MSTLMGDGPGPGQRYEVWCMDGAGGTMQVGWSDQADGGSLTKMVNLHPQWHSPWVIDREAEKFIGSFPRQQ